MYRRRNMATTQVAEAEKNLHKHMTEKNKGKKLRMAGSHRDVSVQRHRFKYSVGQT